MALPRFRCILLSVYLAMLAGAVAISTVGCERSEPGRASQESSGGSESSAPANAPTEAPPTLETAILESRAFNEAPALAERVEKGELPAVSDRLPVHPLVIVPLEEIGTYGGTLRRALTGDIAQRPGVSKSLSEHLMGYSRPVPKTLEHNIAESHEFFDGGKTVVLHIRKGIKWSDGVPFTVDDILFWYYDVAFNDNARGPSSPLPPAVWMVDDEPIRMEKIDENTLRISSPKPLGRVLQNLAGDNVAMPKHVLEKYHPKYNPQASYEEFQRRTSPAQLIMTPGMPQMRAWAPVEWVRGRRLVYERNPYYRVRPVRQVLGD